jgi:predicted amidophosphoribosyltransferase
VGAGRQTRFEQLEAAFEAKNHNRTHGQRILLVDDVLTTGATIESASGVLKDSGAKGVDVVVFAH